MSHQILFNENIFFYVRVHKAGYYSISKATKDKKRECYGEIMMLCKAFQQNELGLTCLFLFITGKIVCVVISG